MLAILVLVIGYLLGSLQFGILLSRALGFGDPRKGGSGNTGATNVARNFGMKMGLLVLLGDMLKGILAVLIAYFFGMSELVAAFAGLAAVVGHMHPVYFGFKGGKGVATALGVIIVLSFPAAIIAVVVMIVVVVLSKYVSLGSMIAAVVATIYMGVNHSGHYMIAVIIMTILIIWRHAPNIKRLIRGTESKFRFKSKK